MPFAPPSLLRGAAALLLAVAVSTSSDLAPPSGSAPVGHWAGPIPGLPNSKLPDAPTLGNGYAGVLLGTGGRPAAAFQGTVELWLNTNAMWGCTPGPTGPSALPVPALCSRVGLGGVRFTPISAVGVDLGPFKVRAEQHITNATLRTVATSTAGSALETTTFMAPEDNVIITSLHWTAAGADPKTLTINISTWVYALGGEVSLQAGSGGTLVAVRNSSRAAGGTSSGSYRRVRTAIAVALAGKGATTLAHTSTGAEQSQLVASGTTVLASGAPATRVVTALSDTLVRGNDHDPAPDAVALAHSTNADTVAAAVFTYWSAFWAKSSISLPDAPAVEGFWRGAQFISACMSASTGFLGKQQGLIPPSGLYGPWVTTDKPSWNGDFTLDYNQEAQYYGVYPSNHGEVAEPYFTPILDWMAAARVAAQQHAKSAGVLCPSTALHYSCHLAPWGYQSHDQSTYMHWNGNFAALLFINKWEYTRNLTWAREAAYPLLDGLNGWWGCFLEKVPATNATAGGGGGSGYVYHDANAKDPDDLGEGQKVQDPQIGLALIRRSLSAQLDMAAALGLPPPAKIADLLKNLVPYNTITSGMCNGAKGTAQCGCVEDGKTLTMNCPDGGTFTAVTFAAVGTPNGTCGSMSRGSCSGDPGKATAYVSGQCLGKSNCTLVADIGHFNGGADPCAMVPKSIAVQLQCSTAAPPDSNRSSFHSTTVWTGYTGASTAQSCAFSNYPLWPAEMVGLDAEPQVVQVARNSLRLYNDSNPGGFSINSRPVLKYPSQVRAGVCDVATAAPFCQTGEDVLRQIEAWIAARQQQNFMPVAPGGGTEQIGVSVAVDDMLVQAPSGRWIELFPVWPKSQPASFSNLLAKGGFEVSASYTPPAAAAGDSSCSAVSGVSIMSVTGGSSRT
jgi:hypothetical protein